MYETHFGLRELPFGLTPDTTFAYTSTTHQEALNTLLVAANNGEGFIKITGEVGTGKTLLCRSFLAALGPSFVSVYIPNPYLQPRALLCAVAEELGVTPQRHDDRHDLMKALMQALLELAAAGKSVVICLDEAQAMADIARGLIACKRAQAVLERDALPELAHRFARQQNVELRLAEQHDLQKPVLFGLEIGE